MSQSQCRCVVQDLKKAALLVFANKQDVRGAMTSVEVSHHLGLTRIKDHDWHIQSCCALTGEGSVSTALLLLPVVSLCSQKTHVRLFLVNPLTPTGCQMVASIKHPVPDRVKPSFVIFDIRALWRSGLSVRVPDFKNYKWQLNTVWHRIFYSRAHMATVGIKGLSPTPWSVNRLKSSDSVYSSVCRRSQASACTARHYFLLATCYGHLAFNRCLATDVRGLQTVRLWILIRCHCCDPWTSTWRICTEMSLLVAGTYCLSPLGWYTYLSDELFPWNIQWLM